MSRNPPPRTNDRFEDYVPVAERLEKFYERFPDGRVITHIIEHNSETGFVLMRAEVYRSPDDAQPAATGHAFEVRGESYVNKTSYVENCECVPLDAEILTRNGFKLYWETQIGEEVLAYDIESDNCVWTPLLRVVTYDDAPVVRYSNRHSFDFLCTPDHSWAVLKQKLGTRNYYRKLTPAREFVVSERIIIAARAEGGTSPITPEEAAAIGWIFTDGSVQRISENQVRVYVCQAKPKHIPELRALLGEVSREVVIPETIRTFPTGKTYATRQGYRWILQAGFVNRLFEKAQIRGADDLPQLVLRLSQEARCAMLRAFIQAEGDEVGRFGQRSGAVFEAFQLLATLEGQALGKLASDSAKTISVQKLKSRRHVCVSQLNREEVGNMPVWCPTTKYGTWVMRQKGAVTITGNTGSVGRALALLGFEVKRGIASREELEKTARMTPDKATARAAGSVSSAAATPTTRAAASEERGVNLDAEILQSAGALGYDATKVRKWIDQKFKVTGGLDALSAEDKREVLRVFREKATPAAAKGTGK